MHSTYLHYIQVRRYEALKKKTETDMGTPNTRPSVRAIFQEEGFKRVLKEVSLAVASVGAANAQLASLEACTKDEITMVARTLKSFT